MKKIFILIAVVLFSFTLISCNSKEKKVDLSGIEFTSQTFTYDGSNKYIEVSNLPDGYTVEYDANVQRAIGTYPVTATIKDAKGNVLGTLKATLTITNEQQPTESSTYDYSKVTLSDLSVTYDGAVHSLQVANFEEGHGYAVNYIGNGQTEVGTYTVTANVIKLSTLEIVKTLTATLTITNGADPTPVVTPDPTVTPEPTVTPDPTVTPTPEPTPIVGAYYMAGTKQVAAVKNPGNENEYYAQGFVVTDTISLSFYNEDDDFIDITILENQNWDAAYYSLSNGKLTINHAGTYDWYFNYTTGKIYIAITSESAPVVSNKTFTITVTGANAYKSGAVRAWVWGSASDYGSGVWLDATIIASDDAAGTVTVEVTLTKDALPSGFLLAFYTTKTPAVAGATSWADCDAQTNNITPTKDKTAYTVAKK